MGALVKECGWILILSIDQGLMGENVETVVIVETEEVNRIILDVEVGLVVIGSH